MSGTQNAPPLDERRQQLQRDFEARRGYWTPWLDALLRLSPDFFAAFLAFTGAPWTSGPLPAKVKEFIYIAIDSGHHGSRIKSGMTKECCHCGLEPQSMRGKGHRQINTCDSRH